MAFWLFLLLAASFAAGQNRPDYVFRHWGLEDGLPLNSIQTILQTSDNYLWIGTECGLVRFDGHRFEIFDRERVPELACDYVMSLCEARTGGLWFGTRGGGLWKLQHSRFQKIDPPAPGRLRIVWALHESADGRLWAGADDGLFCRQQGKWSEVYLPPPCRPSRIRCLMEDDRGRIWAGLRRGGVALVEKGARPPTARYVGLSGENVYSLFQNRQGNLFAGTEYRGAFQLDPALIRPPEALPVPGLADQFVASFYEDGAGRLWIGTMGQGVLLWDHQRRICQPLSPAGRIPGGLIIRILEDREHNIWLATNDDGLVKLHSASVRPFLPESISQRLVFSIFQDSQNRIWTGTNNDGLFLTGPEGTIKLSARLGLHHRRFNSLAETKDGSIWFVAQGMGLCRWRQGRLQILTRREGLADDSIFATLAGRDGRLWIGAADGTVQCWAGDTLTTVKRLSCRINAFLEDRSGRLWAGTMGNGLHCLENGIWRDFSRIPRLAGSMVDSLYEDHDGTIWCGTFRQGLLCLQNGQVRQISRREGLSDNTIFSILEDRQQNLWLGSNRGIMRVGRLSLEEFKRGERNSVDVTVLGRDHGLHSVECVGGFQTDACRTADGKMIFITTKGLVVIDPETIRPLPVPPPVIIESLTFHNREYCPAGPLPELAGEASLEFRFTAPAFLSSDKQRFAWRLDGFPDAAWTETVNQRQAKFENLPPGQYRFQVKTGNHEGAWNPQITEFKFNVTPRFHQSGWFYLGLPAAVLLLSATSWFTGRRLHRNRQEKRKAGRLPFKPGEIDLLVQRLVYLMEEERLYLNPDLCLKDLAGKLHVSPRHLSQVINDRLKKSVIDFVNTYRIQEAKRLLGNYKGNGSSIIQISLQAGFNSKSAFNRAFKLYTNQTPSDYLKKNGTVRRGASA